MKSERGIFGREQMNIMDARSNGPVSPDPICFGPFRLSAAERVLKKDGVRVRLGSRALDILIALVEAPDRGSYQEGAIRKSVAGPCGR
jgi:hypothetical protein